MHLHIYDELLHKKSFNGFNSGNYKRRYNDEGKTRIFVGSVLRCSFMSFHVCIKLCRAASVFRRYGIRLVYVKRLSCKNNIIKINILPGKKVDFFSVFKVKNFIVFVIISALVEIAGTSIAFWIPSYVSDRLRLGVNLSNTIFSVISMIKFVCPFLCLVILRLFKDNMMRLMRVLFLYGENRLERSCVHVERIYAFRLCRYGLPGDK